MDSELYIFWITLVLFSLATIKARDASVVWGYRGDVNRQLTNRTRGRYGVSSPTDVVTGRLVHYVTWDNSNHACGPLHNESQPDTSIPWVALVQRGNCRFDTKIRNAMTHNASAVIVYNLSPGDDLLTMETTVGDRPSVFIKKAPGEFLASLLDNGTNVYVNVQIWDDAIETCGASSVDFSRFWPEDQNSQPLVRTPPESTKPDSWLAADQRGIIVLATGWALFGVLLLGVVGYGVYRVVTSQRRSMGRVVYTVNGRDQLLTDPRSFGQDAI